MGMRTYAIRDRGHDLAVQTWVDGERNHAQLLVDGQEAAAEATDSVGRIALREGDHHVQVAWWWRGRVARCDLVEAAERRGHRTPLAPPAGTRAARLHRFRVEHPRMYAARHVVVQAGAIAVAIFGVGALVSAFLSRLQPDWDLLAWLPDWSSGWLTYVVPLVIAVFVAIEEVERRRKRAAVETDRPGA